MINQLLGDHSSNYMFLGFFIILIIFLLFWWIQRNERRKTLELEQRVSMLTQLVQDTAQNVNKIIERGERNPLNQGVQQEGQSSQNVQQSTQGTQVSHEDIINETDLFKQPSTSTPKVPKVDRVGYHKEIGTCIFLKDENEQVEEQEHEQDDSSDDGNYSELDSLTDEDEVNAGDGDHDVERIEVSDIEDIQSVTQENVSSQFVPSASDDKEPVDEVKTINLEGSEQQNEVSQPEPQQPTNVERYVVDEELQKQYNKMTVKELRKIGEEKEIEQVDKMKKKTIVDVLSRVLVDNHSQTKNVETTTNDNE